MGPRPARAGEAVITPPSMPSSAPSATITPSRRLMAITSNSFPVAACEPMLCAVGRGAERQGNAGRRERSWLHSSLVLVWALVCTVRDLAAPAVPALAAAATPSGSAARQRMTAVRRMLFLPVADWWVALWLGMFPPSPSLGVRCFAAARGSGWLCRAAGQEFRQRPGRQDVRVCAAASVVRPGILAQYKGSPPGYAQGRGRMTPFPQGAPGRPVRFGCRLVLVWRWPV